MKMSFNFNDNFDKTNSNEFNDKTNSNKLNNNKSNNDFEILEASKVLHLALQQMDGIIASNYSLLLIAFLIE